MNHSLRMRLITGAVGASVLILLAIGGGLYLVVARSLSRQFDHTLLVRVLAAAASLDWNDQHGRLEVKIDADVAARGGTSLHTLPRLMEIWNARRHVIYRSPALRGADLAYIPVMDAGPVYRRFQLTDGRHGREVLLAIGANESDGGDLSGNAEVAAPATPLVLAVGHPINGLAGTLNIIFWSILLACLMAAGLLALTLSLIAGRSLMPLDLLAAKIGRVAVDDLSERLVMNAAPSELLPVVDRLNDLLGRLEATVVREKALTADIAHELRTPLAAIQTGLEVSLSRLRDGEAYRRTAQSTLAVARVVDAIFGEYQAVFARKNVQALMELDTATEIHTDSVAVEIILRNVLDNAAAYVNCGGTLKLAVKPTGAGLEIRISNTGSAVAAADTMHVFERFWRGDQARNTDGGHCGLGLALVKRLVDLLGGTARAESQQGGEFTVRILLQDA